MSKKSDYNTLRDDRKAIAAVAASSVDGYLRNASRRHRVPAAEGGRGTRRKLAMVTSASVVEEQPAQPIVDADDEWDEVDLPAIPVKKQEVVKTDNSAATGETPSASGVKGEASTSGLPLVKDEYGSAMHPPSTSATGAKTETVVVDDYAAVGSAQAAAPAIAGEDCPPLPQGTRAPLMERPQRTAWNQRRDPAYEAMREQVDLVAAQRCSERIQRTSVAIVGLIALLERGRLLWQQSRHPQLLRALLALHRPISANEKEEESADEPAAKKPRRTHSSSSSNNNQKTKSATASDKKDQPQAPRRAYVLSRAVTEAKALAKEARDPKHAKPSLAPAWVTPARDTVRNKTSEAVTVLLKAINSAFELQLPATNNGTTTITPSAAAPQGNHHQNEEEDVEEDPAAAAAAAAAAAVMADWSAPLEPCFLIIALQRHRALGPEETVKLPHTLYFSLLFLALAAMARLDCRLVVAKQVEKRAEAEAEGGDGAQNSGSHNNTNHRGNRTGEDDGAEEPRLKLAKMSVFLKEPKKRGRPGQSGDKNDNKHSSGGAHEEGEQVKSKKLPSSCFWVEVWSLERNSFVAVNPCAGSATLWGAPFTFSIAGDVVVDATPRYTSKYSTAFSFNRRLGRVSSFGFLWKDQLRWDDNREISEVLLETFSKQPSATTASRQPREQKQLESLAYAEPVPTTLAALHRHPLFVIESDLARHEGVHPKNAATTVGRVKGHMVYKRSAVVNLRSRDGWLREGRSLLDDDNESAYKEVPPPASRPFIAPSRFYGLWQTRAFTPLPLRADGTIPHHGRTSWYILLGAEPPEGLVHLTQPQIARVARRMQLDMGLAVVGFHKRQVDERRRGQWEAVIEGIVVRQADQQRLLHAYVEWMQLVQEQEAAKRRDRAMHWWLLFTQRRLAMDRLRAQYLDGSTHGSLPAM